jgi:glyoxalase family protein
MSPSTAGIHHVTAIAGEPQRNLDFYEGVLGLRLVKRTVNFDDPGTYHLYYGDGVGYPGTIMTFFPWPGAPKGRRGTGQVAATAFSVPRGAVGYWVHRLVEHGVAFEGPTHRFEETIISFEDPDGLWLELVAGEATGDEDLPYWEGGPVPGENAVRGFFGVTLWEEGHDRTTGLLTDGLGLRPVRDDGKRFRFAAEGGGPGSVVDVVCQPEGWRGAVAVGTVHHVAFRAAGEEEQLEWRREIAGRGLDVTPVLDRNYFRSIYFREPGGVLFEIATDSPGFAVDEDPEHLGEELKLPPSLERRRRQLEEVLPPLRLSRSGEPVVEQKKLDFEHRFVPGRDESAPTILLLHGTGGDENDLIPLGSELAPRANLLSPRGKVLEHGMPRFFRRLAEGVFDEEDLKFRTEELAGFVEEAAGRYGLDPNNLFAVGFSNGANIAASLLLMRPGLLSGAVLFRPMVPFEPEELPDLSGVPVYLGAGEMDQIVPRENTGRLAELLERAGAEVSLNWRPGGHGLEMAEVREAREWLSRKMPAAAPSGPGER